MRRKMALLVMWTWCSLVPWFAFGQENPAKVVGVMPGREGNLVVCHLKTTGLPAEKQLQSMRSGLVSSVELDLALLDENDELLGGNTMTLRLAFDLWEEVFSVREDGKERRFQNLADLETYLAELSNLPVTPAANLNHDHRYRLRVGMVINSIAQEEQKRVVGVIAGDNRPRREGQDQQEASVSLGRLIRLFYKGGNDGRGGIEQHSKWFEFGELSDEAN
jgi:hypothetical protein